MSRGEAIASPTDPTPSGYRGSVTLDPSGPKGGPGEVTEPACSKCGLGFRPARPKHEICPECWKAEQPKRAECDREDAINEAECRWKQTQERWGKR